MNSSPQLLEIRTDDDGDIAYRLEEINRVLEENDIIPSETEIRFLSLIKNVYTFKVNGITEVFQILKIFQDNYIDDVIGVEEYNHTGDKVVIALFR